MKTYTLNEVSKIINVPNGKMRQWEKEYSDIIEIPRSKQGARIYTDTVIELFVGIKEMYAKKMCKDSIREELNKKLNPPILTSAVLEDPSEGASAEKISPLVDAPAETIAPAVDVASETISSVVDVTSETISPVVGALAETLSPVPIPAEEAAMKNSELFFAAMDTYKRSFLNEVKSEISNVVRKEVLEEVKKEINKGTLTTVKSLSDSIYKASAYTKAELEELGTKMEQTSEQTADSMKYLSNSIANVSIETAEEIYNLSRQISATTEELTQSVDATNNELYSLTEALSKDREYFMEEREQFRNEIQQRELAFQNMLSGFRDAAPAKEKKWWKFWA